MIRVLQMNCGRSGDVMTDFLRSARREAEVVLIQEPWVRENEEIGGGWQTIGDGNFIFLLSTGTGRRPKTLIGVKRDVEWHQYAGVDDPDLIAVEIDGVRIFNVYNQRHPEEVDRQWTLDRIDIRPHLTSQWVVAGDFNAHHPIWTGEDRLPVNWQATLRIIEAGTLMLEPGTATRIGRSGQQNSTIDLVIASPRMTDRMGTAEVAEDLQAGSDHECISWGWGPGLT